MPNYLAISCTTILIAVFILAAVVCINKWRILWAMFAIGGLLYLMQPYSKTDLSLPTQHRLLWYNVHLNNPDALGESQLILAQQADVLALAEINFNNPDWQKLHQHYPHGCAHQEYSPFALAVLSKHPLTICKVHFIGEFPYIHAQYGNTTLFALHPPPPINAALAQARHNYFTQLIPLIQANPRVLVVGDFNSSPFSPLFRQFLQHSQLKQHAPLYQATWRPLMLNIDPILSKNRNIHSHALPFHASDHRALVANW